MSEQKLKGEILTLIMHFNDHRHYFKSKILHRRYFLKKLSVQFDL